MKRRFRIVLACVAALAGRALGAEPGLERQVLFRAGDGGYASYRIPSAVAVGDNTVLAFCEARKTSGADSGEIGIVLRRSTDGGRTFGPTQTVWADGANTCGNPCAVADGETGRIWVLMTHNLGQDRERDIISGKAKGTRTVWINSSSDGGVSWASPREITDQVKKLDWAWYATGPGVGIQLKHGPHKGRLLIPCDHVTRGGGEGGANAHVIYSDDHGQTWHIGGEPPEHRFNESQAVELDDGRVLLNMRNYEYGKHQGDRSRGVAISTDGGETFGPARADARLPEPVCQASILRYSWPGDGLPGVILFANPASRSERAHMMVRLSQDGGATWPAGRVIWDGPSAYSCLVKLPDGQVGLLYEAGDKRPYERIEFARFGVDWVEKSGE